MTYNVKDKLTNEMKGKFVIVDIRNRGFMLNEEGEINFYDTMDEACTVCGMYELENVWVMQLMYNHIELEAKTSASNVSSITAVDVLELQNKHK